MGCREVRSLFENVRGALAKRTEGIAVWGCREVRSLLQLKRFWRV
ncbi:MAG: hypothetical protein ACKO2Z_18990 [Sphaerospermopsis kisseleviana]